MTRRRAAFSKRGVLAFRADLWGAFFEVAEEKLDYEERGNIAIVRIEGPLTQHAEWFWDSYDAIKSRVGAALNSAAEVVVLRIDSPGGEVSGCFETARELRALAAQKGKRVVAFADGMAASAGYALACAASEIYLPSTGIVGSIGVISTICDVVGMNAQIGLNVEVIASGKRKRYGNPNVPITDAAVATVQQEVDYLADLFIGLVAESRGLAAEKVSALEAGVLIGQQAVAASLANGVCTFDELLESLSSGSETKASVDADDKEDNMGWKDALKKAAEEGDEEAKKALQALDDEDEKKAEDSDEKKEDKAEGSDSDDEKKDEKKDEDEKESKAAASDLKLAATVQSLSAWKADLEEKEERGQLMSSRPDLAAEVVAFLERQPLAVVRDAVKTLPKGAVKAKGQVNAARAAIGVAPTEATRSESASEHAHELDVQMGLSKGTSAIRLEGNRHFIGVMTPAEASAELARRESAAKKGAA